MDRVAFVGSPGSGKSTLAAEVAQLIDGSTIELDALFHRPGWEPTPTPEFRAAVLEATTASERWASAGNYSIVMDIVHGRADTIVWLDLPRWLVTLRVIRRSIGRVVRREELWNGNREQLRRLLSRDPEHSIVVWTWTQFPKYRDRYQSFLDGPLWSHADVHRLRSRRDVRHFVESLSAS